MEPTDEAVLAHFPMAAIDRDNVAYYRGLLQQRLLINRCTTCSRWHHPPFPRCPFCWSTRLAAEEPSGRGRVHLFTTLHLGAPTNGVDYTQGHTLVTVELVEQEGLRVTAPFVRGQREDLRVGLPVRLVFITRGGHPVPAFEPAPLAAT